MMNESNIGMNEPIIVAVELGTSRISGIAGKKKDGSFQILAYAEEQTTACIKRGLVYNVEKTTRSIQKVVEMLSQTLGQKVYRVYVGIGGQSVRSIRKKVPRNMLEQTSITAAHIEELRKESMDIAIPDYELLENIPQGYIIDSSPTDDPQGVYGSNIEGEFLNIVARKQLRGNIQTCFNNVGIEIAGTKLSPIELAKNMLTEHEKRAGCAMVDLGAGTTTVVVYKQNIIRYLVTIPIGFNNIVDDLKSLLQIEDKEATDVLIKYGNAYVDPDEDVTELLKDNYKTSNGNLKPVIGIHEIINARLTEIIVNAVVQIVNSGYSDVLLAGVVITGGGANMKNIDKAFKNNPRQKKFELIRVAKSIVQPVIKSTNAASLTLDNAMSGSVISLLLSGGVNCVSPQAYSGNDIFEANKTDQTIHENTAKNDAEKKLIDDMIARLTTFKDRMREHINRLIRQQNAIEANPKNKALRNEGLQYIDEAMAVCNEDYNKLLQSLEVKLKNDQRINEAKSLEQKLSEQASTLKDAIAKAKKSTSLFERWKAKLENLVNGEGENE
jgi:cell division protein FtsA